MKNSRYEVKSNKPFSDIVVSDKKIGKRKLYSFPEFIRNQMLYNPETAKYPKYVNDKVWEIEERMM